MIWSVDSARCEERPRHGCQICISGRAMERSEVSLAVGIWLSFLLYVAGVAVVGVMVVTTCFLSIIMVMVWQVPLWVALAFLFLFGSIELVYFSAVLYKVPQFGWLPLLFVGVFLVIMYTWHYARKEMYKYEESNKISIDSVLSLGSSLGMVRVPGIGLVYTELAQVCPGSVKTHLLLIHSCWIVTALLSSRLMILGACFKCREYHQSSHT